MTKIGITRKGERIEISYNTEMELEYYTCLKQVVSFPEDEKAPVKAPVNRQIDAKRLNRR